MNKTTLTEKDWKIVEKIALSLSKIYMDELFASGKRSEAFITALKRIGKRKDGKKGST